MMRDVTNWKADWRFFKCQWGRRKKRQKVKTHPSSRHIYTWPCRTQIPSTIGKDNLMKVTILCCHEHKIKQEGAEVRKQVF